MNIVKYKKGAKGKYKVYLDNNDVLVLYEEVILKYNLLLTKKIDNDLLVEIDRYNQECDVYYVALNSINARFKSIFELRMFLKRKEYPDDLIDKAIDKLLEQGYLNDRLYARSYINTQIITTNKGPFVLEKELLDKKISIDIIKEEMENFTDEEQISRINKMIEKGIKINHTRGGIVLKQKIYNDLKKLGYDISLINQVISNYTFDNDKELAKKEYDKLIRKYSRKYEGYELKQIVREKMYQKGLKYEEQDI